MSDMSKLVATSGIPLQTRNEVTLNPWIYNEEQIYRIKIYTYKKYAYTYKNIQINRYTEEQGGWKDNLNSKHDVFSQAHVYHFSVIEQIWSSCPFC